MFFGTSQLPHGFKLFKGYHDISRTYSETSWGYRKVSEWFSGYLNVFKMLRECSLKHYELPQGLWEVKMIEKVPTTLGELFLNHIAQQNLSVI